MTSNMFKSSVLLTAAVGAGVMIGAAGVFLYDHIVRQKRRLILQQDVLQLGLSVSELQREIEAIREAQEARRRRRRTKSDEKNSHGEMLASISGGEHSETDMLSIVDDDEFFDFSDDEDYPSLSGHYEYREEITEDNEFKDIDFKLNSHVLSHKIEALDELQEKLEERREDPEILWRLAKVNHGIGMLKGITDGLDAKKAYIDRGIEVATECLRVAPRLAESHKWYAICVGSRGEFQPIKDKIKDGFVFKEHVEEALKISPEDPTLLHLLGRFRFEVATLTWIERKMASTIYSEVPYSTFPEAVEPLKRVEDLKQEPWLENRLVLAKCYIKMGQYVDAIYWLDKCVEIEPKSMEEVQLHKEVMDLQRKYNNYRTK